MRPDKSSPRTAANGAGAKVDAWQQDHRQHRAAPQPAEDAGPTLFDQVDELDEGRRRRDAGVKAAGANTWTPWRISAENALQELIAAGAEFVSDDIIERTGEPPLSSRNAVGALIQSAARRGLIRRVGYTQSRRASRNAAVVAVWRGQPGRASTHAPAA